MRYIFSILLVMGLVLLPSCSQKPPKLMRDCNGVTGQHQQNLYTCYDL